MGILTNKRHELFAQYIVQGVGQPQAYVKAGYSGGSQVASCASRLYRNVQIQARIAQLQGNIVQVAVQTAGIDKAWVMARLQENISRSMQAEPVRDSDGNAIGEYAYNASAANRALELIGKELGMFVDRKDITVRKPISEMTEAELLQLYTEARATIEANQHTSH